MKTGIFPAAFSSKTIEVKPETVVEPVVLQLPSQVTVTVRCVNSRGEPYPYESVDVMNDAAGFLRLRRHEGEYYLQIAQGRKDNSLESAG